MKNLRKIGESHIRYETSRHDKKYYEISRTDSILTRLSLFNDHHGYVPK